jgi:hypothetical protein
MKSFRSLVVGGILGLSIAAASAAEMTLQWVTTDRGIYDLSSGDVRRVIENFSATLVLADDGLRAAGTFSQIGHNVSPTRISSLTIQHGVGLFQTIDLTTGCTGVGKFCDYNFSLASNALLGANRYAGDVSLSTSREILNFGTSFPPATGSFRLLADYTFVDARSSGFNGYWQDTNPPTRVPLPSTLGLLLIPFASLIVRSRRAFGSRK